MAAYISMILLEEMYRRKAMKERVFRDREDPFSLPDRDFKSYFRLPKESVHYLVAKLQGDIENSRLSPTLKILVALRFFGTGCFQGNLATDRYLAISQSSVSKCISEVSKAICTKMAKEFVNFPVTTEMQEQVKKGFCDKFGVPGVLGVIDCTHVNILSPSVEGHAYINRKGVPSINVQLVCDVNLMILAVNAKFPVSVHDSFIFRQSKVRMAMEKIHRTVGEYNWLIGDSGYGLEPFIMVPYMHPHDSAQENFNKKVSVLRSTIERANGVLKHRFRCLSRQRILMYSPALAGNIINSCVVLHNMCISHNIDIDGYSDDESDMSDSDEEFNDKNIEFITRQPSTSSNAAESSRQFLAHYFS